MDSNTVISDVNFRKFTDSKAAKEAGIRLNNYMLATGRSNTLGALADRFWELAEEGRRFPDRLYNARMNTTTQKVMDAANIEIPSLRRDNDYSFLFFQPKSYYMELSAEEQLRLPISRLPIIELSGDKRLESAFVRIIESYFDNTKKIQQVEELFTTADSLRYRDSKPLPTLEWLLNIFDTKADSGNPLGIPDLSQSTYLQIKGIVESLGYSLPDIGAWKQGSLYLTQNTSDSLRDKPIASLPYHVWVYSGDRKKAEIGIRNLNKALTGNANGTFGDFLNSIDDHLQSNTAFQIKPNLLVDYLYVRPFLVEHGIELPMVYAIGTNQYKFKPSSKPATFNSAIFDAK